MANPPLTAERPRWLFPLIMLLVGLVLGYLIGQRTMEAKAKLGQCVQGDSTVVSGSVSQQECEERCPTCMWEQNLR
jgi:uncharacterized membrane-anchored protein YhcB (DUF1043 family)